MDIIYKPRAILTSGDTVSISGTVIVSGNVTVMSGAYFASGQPVCVSGQIVPTRYEDINTVVLSDILKELKKINMQLSLITDNEVTNSDLEG
jgi:hypothetical protein